MTDGTMPDPTPALTEAAERVSDMLDRLLAHPGEDRIERRLFECMRYACLGPGKRLRPFLVLYSSALFGVSPSAALRVAAAVEMVHAYSLVHDDLPAMDDDDLRRGRPSAHRAYDEATAILAGDGLLTYAFDVLASEATHSDPRVIVDLISTLARAAGPHGMVGGQMMDLEAENRLLDQVQTQFGEGFDRNVAGWVETPQLRTALGKAAKASEWFKRQSWGREWAAAISGHLGDNAISESDLVRQLASLRGWIDNV